MRNRVGLFFGLVFPVILILIFGAIFSASSGSVTVYVQDKDTGPFLSPQMDVSSQFLSALNSSGTLNVVMVDPSVNLSSYLAQHSASDGIIIPANFSENYLAAHQVNVTVYGNPSSTSSSIVSGTVSGVANLVQFAPFQWDEHHRVGPDDGQHSADEVHRFPGPWSDRILDTR